MDQKEEIKSRLDLIDFLREYIPLKSAGANFKANCPFHHEKTASFMVSPEKQIWHCFGCGRGGDIFGFLMEIENLSFGEALRQLAPKAGVELRAGDFQASSGKNRLLDLVDLATEYYHRALLSHKPGLESAKIREYLTSRGLGEKDIKNWRLGYSPASSDSLVKFLLGRKFSLSEISAVGLSLQKETGAIDRFRQRLMFPLSDISGRPVAFSARVLPWNDDQSSGKYINSPQTDLYDKSRLVFGLDKAKQEIKKKDLAVVVEGQMDLISCHSAGYLNVVATSGTALTSEQLLVLKRYSNNIALAFDSDKAGRLATGRALASALSLEMTVKIIRFPEEQDPDQCRREDPELFKKIFSNPRPWLEVFLDFKKKEIGDLSLLENKKKFLIEFWPFLSLVKNKVELGASFRRLSEICGVAEGDLREEFLLFSKAKKEPVYKKETEKEVVEIASLDRAEKLSQALLALLTKFPEVGEYLFNNLEDRYLFPEKARFFYKQLLNCYNKTAKIEYLVLKEHLSGSAPDLLPFLDYLILLGDKDFSVLESHLVKNEALKLLQDLRLEFMKKEISELKAQISSAEAEGRDSTELFSRLQEISTNLKNNFYE